MMNCILPGGRIGCDKEALDCLIDLAIGIVVVAGVVICVLDALMCLAAIADFYASGGAGVVVAGGIGAGLTRAALTDAERLALSDAERIAAARGDKGIPGLLCKLAAHSFDANTRILMADATIKTITNIELGDQVLATDPTSQTTTARAVTAIHTHDDTELTDILVDTRSGSFATVHTTQDHSIWDATTQRWVAAGHLQPGDELAAISQPNATVAEVTNRVGRQTMYNLTVADVHTYYVVAGNTPVLVHNAGCDPLPTQVKGQTQRLTNAQATDLANYLGYRYTGQTLRGEKVFTNGKTYIVQDTTSHNGGTWKIANSISDLNSKTTRTATTDALLNPIGG